jgi:hypothetical protein
MSSIEKLTAAPQADVMVYMPYCPKEKRDLLPYAISLYKQGSLEGERQIEASDNIPFVATWFVSKLPSELTRCQLQFDGQADLSYDISISNADLIKYLIDVLEQAKRSRQVDFSQEFYRKLLNVE